jgi:UDP-N-acetylmuramoyl-tripeptide--D-alanyl-D-alanine ligase
MDLTLAELATATGGELVAGDGTVVVTSFSIDSRSLESGACFVALRDARDGHTFVGHAFERGAVAALVERVPSPAPGPLVVVADVPAALGDLGRAARERLGEAFVVGITGSAGKTSRKDLAAAALATRHAVHASPASYNNEAGVPLTLLGAPVGTEAIVVEMGARFPGNIADLCVIARPTVGIVTQVGLAHAEHLRGRAGIADVKGELLEALPAGGLAVLGADDDLTPALARRSAAPVLRVGVGRAHVGDRAADVRVTALQLDDELRPRFRLESPWGAVEVRLQVRGEHQALNAGMAVVAAVHGGVPLEDACGGVAGVTGAAWRMQLERSPVGVTVLNDAYNASPTSMAAALRAFAHLPTSGRRVAVLGEMLELGADAEAAHAAAGELAATHCDAIVVVGAGTAGPRALAAAARAAGTPSVIEVGDAAAALNVAVELLEPGDAVLVKASRAVGLETVAVALLAGAPVTTDVARRGGIR